MALQVWLPLNGNVKNQGLMDISPQAVGSGIWENGKIGKCYNGTGNGYINLNASITMNGAFSIALWIKVNSFNGAWARIFGFYKNVDEYLGMCYSNTNTIGFHMYDSVNGTKTSLYDAYRYTPVVGEWSHITLVFDGIKTMKWYKDGNLLHTDTNVKSFVGDIYTQCAICSIGNGNNKADCSLNDFRLYDTALSPREVKEISKGLVLHYPLSIPGNENILAGNYSCITTATSHTASGVATTQGINNLFVANQGKKLWFSFDYSTEGERQAGSGSLGNRYGAHLSFRYTKTDGTLSSQIYPCASYLTMSGTGRAEMSYTLPTDIQSVNNFSISLQPNARPASGNTATWYLKNFKLEIGERATPWVPNPADPAYTALGFNDGIEYDVSGYQHNGTKVGTITYDVDTPRYETSAVFDGSSYIINNTSTIHLSNEFTIAWWGKVNSWQKKWEGMFLLQNTPTLQSGTEVVRILSCIHGSTQGVMDLAIGQSGASSSFDHYSWSYIIGEWAHYACTYKAGVVRMYKDGSQTYTATIQDNSSNDYYFTIGRRNSNCDCQISDFRIYNTALSADAVKELYQTSASLADNGTLMAYQFNEV